MIVFLLRIVLMLLSIVAMSMLIPLGFAIYHRETDTVFAFLLPMVAFLIPGILAFIFKQKSKPVFSMKAGFVVVAGSWILACILGALPLMISGYIPSFFDAFFESASGFTTTGASILSSVEALPVSLNIWRAEMHWLGGMGIVAMTVALMPILGIGGFTLIKAETTGPDKGKITPKIAQTAKILWFIYIFLTFIQIVLLLFTDMNFSESVFHTFGSLGTGGFSMKDSGLANYSPAAQWICTVFMLIAGTNFALYYLLMQKRGKEFLQNTEVKVYWSIVILATAVVTIALLPVYKSFSTSVRHAAFQVVSVLTTTGFATADYVQWPQLAQSVLFLLLFIGGCSASTAGGVKVVRWTVLFKQMMNEIKRMLHPYGVFTIHLNGKAGRKDIVYSVAAFIFLYFLLVAITTLIASLNGVDLLTSFTSGLALVGNVGPGFGKVGPTGNYGFYSSATKLWFSFAMLAGRLELYTIFIFLTPHFWKR